MTSTPVVQPDQFAPARMLLPGGDLRDLDAPLADLDAATAAAAGTALDAS